MKKDDRMIRGGRVVFPDGVREASLVIGEEKIQEVLAPDAEAPAGCDILDARGRIVMPGMIDTHNHMCDPGPFNYREDWYHGTMSAASGGITTICDMPLPCEPETTNVERFLLKERCAEEQAVVDFAFWGGLIPGNISELRALHEAGVIGFKGFMCFATESYPRISDEYLVEGMRETASLGALITLHAENADIAAYGTKQYADAHCEDYACFDDARPWWTEYDAIQRAVLFAKNTGARVQLCHTTIAEGAAFIKQAKKERAAVYMETCPHYLIFDHDILRTCGAFAKCTPPFRSRKNVEKLWDYVLDGTVDVIGTDHGPFSDAEKEKEGDFWKEYCGFGCNDVALGALITEGVHKRGLSWERLACLTSLNASKNLGLYPKKGNLLPGADADIILIDPDAEWVYDGTTSFSKTKSAKGPYQGMRLKGKVTDTFVRGKHVFSDGVIKAEAGYGKLVRRGER